MFSELDRKYAAAVRENKELKEILSKEIDKEILENLDGKLLKEFMAQPLSFFTLLYVLLPQ